MQICQGLKSVIRVCSWQNAKRFKSEHFSIWFDWVNENAYEEALGVTNLDNQEFLLLLL